jgi:MFS family permease
MEKRAEIDGSYGWIIATTAIYALIVSNGLTTTGIPVFYKPIREEFVRIGAVDAASAETFIANAANITFIASGVFSLLAGWLIPRLGLKKLMTGGCVLLAGGLFLHSNAESAAMVYLSRLLMGASLGFVGVMPNVALVSGWFQKKRGAALGIVLTGTSLGGVLVPMLAVPLITAYGWRAAMLIISSFVWAVLLPAVVWLVRDGPLGSADQLNIEAMGLTLAQALRKPIFWSLAICAAAVFYPIFVTTQQFILYLQSPKIGLSLAAAGWAQSGLFAFSILGKSLWGTVSDQVSPTKVMLFCCGLMFASTLILSYLTPSSAWLFLLPFGLGYGGAFVLLQRLSVDYFGLREYGKILGTITMIEIIGAAIGSRVTGYLADAAGGDYTKAFFVTIFAAGISFVAATILLLLHSKEKTGPDVVQV